MNDWEHTLDSLRKAGLFEEWMSVRELYKHARDKRLTTRTLMKHYKAMKELEKRAEARTA